MNTKHVFPLPKACARTRFLYIIEASLEYFISILIGEAYLAKVGTSIGLSDAAVGLLYSFVSLGTAFQLIAILFANKTPVKRWVTPLHILNQMLFVGAYVTAFLPQAFAQRTTLFIICLLLGQIIANLVSPAKINWLMSMVDDHKRGVFTANKEIVSLISGMIFTNIMSHLVDKFESEGNVTGAFIVMGITIFVLMLLHTLTLVFSAEKPVEKENISLKENLKILSKDKVLFKIIGISVLWNVANYATTPFFGTYKNNDLGFTMAFNAFLSAGYSILRAIVSRPLGKFADRYSFPKMLNICFGAQLIAYSIAMFCTPLNGKILFPIYYLLNAVAMGGINSGAINLIYDYVDKHMRTSALALKNTFAGIVGFLTTLIVTIPVNYIQKNRNSLFGISVYAQQVTSAFGMLVVLGILIYLNTVIRKIKRNENR